ncbi:tryptophan dimethylallyltransferase family protein [Streptomyces rishiriensis]|uniref:DMATS type aromatic prenyltransferase n=1 Tax=Streptomyces rishiriensis TaxID=68264 RepID=A0ABU0NZ98_STRRH|nr:tryptophan dimethylallyltransferase family protein [Streptomyces rishiriensis]MDQ0584482.1 DMATS type aromatic prenyltransferase [Streptomyces rishiriensis]
MTATGAEAPGTAGRETLGGHAARQLLRLAEVAGLSGADSTLYARTLVEALGPVAQRSLDLPPPGHSFLSDDHTPVEFSLSCEPGAAPTLRVLLEPGAGAADLAEDGRTGLAVVREMGRRWGFATDRLDDLADLFFPSAPEGPLALWCALELRPGGVPKVKVYLNPAASGEKRAAKTVRKALKRLGHREAFDALPEGDRHVFFALDLGDWTEPRVKVYLAHHDLSAAQACTLSRMDGGPGRAEVEEFFRIVAGSGPGADADGLRGGVGAGAVQGAGKGAGGGGEPRLARRPVQTCHALTDTGTGVPSGFTLYIPVRDYARHDGEALDRATALLGHYGIDPAPVLRAAAAVTSRRPEDGVGLVAYLGLAHQQGRPPRILTYLSSEAYEVRPPTAAVPAAALSTPAPPTVSLSAAAVTGRQPSARPMDQHRPRTAGTRTAASVEHRTS